MSAAADPWIHVRQAASYVETVGPVFSTRLCDLNSSVAYAAVTLIKLAKEAVLDADVKKTGDALEAASSALQEAGAVLDLVAASKDDRDLVIQGAVWLLDSSARFIDAALVELGTIERAVAREAVLP